MFNDLMCYFEILFDMVMFDFGLMMVKQVEFELVVLLQQLEVEYCDMVK